MPLQALQEGGLAGSVGADESEDLPGADLEGDGVDGGEAPVGPGQVLDGDGGVHDCSWWVGAEVIGGVMVFMHRISR